MGSANREVDFTEFEASVYTSVDDNCMVMVFPQFYLIEVVPIDGHNIRMSNMYSQLKEMFHFHQSLLKYPFPITTTSDITFWIDRDWFFKVHDKIIDISNKNGQLFVFAHDAKRRAEDLMDAYENGQPPLVANIMNVLLPKDV